jgi:RNA polymerase sigma-70 factor (sigma-E family)
MTAVPATGAGEDFAALFDASFETMKRLAFLLGADDPENIAQESFLRLHAKWHTLAGPDKALPYLRRTVINLSRSRLRHLRVVRRIPEERFADAASAETAVLERAEHRSLWAALATLSERQRRVIVLRFWLDLDQVAIAETLGVAVGTVKATTSQALAKLRTVWPDEEAAEA